MPRIQENEAAALAQGIDTLNESQKPQALDILTRYKQQQDDLGEPEWPSQVAAQQAARDSLHSMFTGGIDKVPFEVSPWSKDPALDKAMVANQAFLAARYNKPVQEIADRPDFYRDDYARQFFGQPGGVDEKAFYGLAAKQIQGEQQSEAATLDGVKAAMQGHDIIPALQEWQQKNGLDRMPDSTQFTKGFLIARQKSGDQLEFADTLLKQIESNTGLTKGDGAQRPAPAGQEQAAQFESSLATLAAMKPRDRKQVYAIIGAKAEAAGYDPKGFWGQMLSELGKGMARMGSSVTTQAGVTADVLGNFPAMLSNTMKPEEFASTDASIAKRQGIGEMYDEVANIVGGAVDPVKPVLSWMNDSLETGLIKGPGAVGPFMMASAALGPVGAGALFTADFAEQNRRDLRAQGMDNEQAMKIGLAAAPLQAAVESLSNAVQLGRFPAVQAALAPFTKPIAKGGSVIGRYVQNAATSFGLEFSEEQLQDNVIRPVTQDIVAAFDKDVPGAQMGQIWENIKKSSPDLMWTLAPMALVFGGTMTAAQANLSSVMVSSQDMLEAAGFSGAQANSIRAEASPDAQISKARELWGSRAGTAQSMEDAAKSVGERMRLLQTDHVAAQQDLERRGILPRMLRAADDKWRLTFNDGSTADFNSHNEADAARWQWATDQLGKVHLATREALAQMEKNAAVGREFAVEFKPDAMTAQQAVDEGRVDPAQIQRRVAQGEAAGESVAESASETDTYDNAVATDKAMSDEHLASLQILGSSSNEFKDGVLRTTIRLYEGAHVLTLVEEKLEGDAKQIVASKPGRAWMLQSLRNYERVSGDKLLRTDDDASLHDDDLIEAWSSLGQSYLVGHSKKGASIGKGGARRIFADVLKSGMGGAMNAETQFFNAVWRRAAKLSKLKREGKLGSDITEELERQLGIDSQEKHETEAAKEADAIANEALNAGGASYSEESPGPNGETFSVRKFNMPSLAGAAASLQSMKQGGNAVDFPTIYKAARVGKSSDWQTLNDLFAEAKKQNPKLTEAEFGKQVQALYNSGHVMLEPGDSSQSMTDSLTKYGVRDSINLPASAVMPMATGETHSISSGDFSSRMSAAFSPFQRSPELRLAIAQVAKARAMRLGAEWIEKAAELRGAGSISKEARMREAMAYETRMNEYLNGLTESARQDLEFEPSKLESDPLIAAMLDHGKLMSRSTAMQQGKLSDKAGEYDGVPWLPPSWYSKGAGIMPDQMAQAMHDAGLLPDAHADTLWQALDSRIESSRKDKARAREAAQSYKAAQKYAKDASRAESDKWTEGAKKKAGSPKAQREMLKSALRTLDGILSAAPPEVRARVGGYVKLAGLATDEKMLEEIERRIEKLNVELEKWLKKEGREQLEKLLKKARPDNTPGKKGKGKDADMHALFAAAEKSAKMDDAGVAGELARLDSLIAGDTLTPEQETLATTERGIVELVGDLKNADSGRIFSAIDTLRSIYDGGWLKWKLAEIERKERRAGMRQDFISDTGKTGLKPERDAADKAAATLLGKIKGGFLSLSSFHEVLSYAFGEKSERVTSLVDAERAASGQYEDVNQALADEVEALFTSMAGGTLKGERLRFDLAQRTIKTAKGEFSQLEAIQALLMWRQDDGRRHMEGAMDESGKPSGKWHYNQAWIDEITAALTPEARQVMGWIMQKYGAEWGPLNALYRSRYGVNMPAHDNYAPITVAPAQTKAGEVVDPVTGAAMSSGSILTPGSLRTRSRNAIAEPEFRDALQTLLNHTRQLEYWKAYYDLAVEANAILGNRDVLNAVKAKGGEPAATALRKWVDAIAQGGFRDAASSLEMNKLLGRMTGRAATVGLLGRVSTLLVQSTQLAAAAVKMPMGHYLVGMSKLLTGNLSYGDAIKSDFIQRRFKSAPPIVRQAMENLGAQTRPNMVKHAARSLGQILSGADALFTAGTYALLLDYHRGTGRAMGMSGAELETHAHTEAERDTEQVAQPTRMATRSLAEITSTNPLAKITWAYASEARQKIALAAWAATKATSDPAYFAKVAFLTFGVGGLMTQLLKNLWKEAKGDDDEKKWTPERLVISMLSSPLHGIPVVGSLMNDGNMLSGASHIKNVDFSGSPTDIMRDVDTVLSVMGMFNDTAASTAALSHAGIDAAKVLENLTSGK